MYPSASEVFGNVPWMSSRAELSDAWSRKDDENRLL